MVITSIESQLAKLCEREYTTLTFSGSMAIITALKSADLPPNSKVIIPASCCPIVLFSIQMAGFDVVLADVSLDSLSMEVAQIEAVFNDEVSAILAVHGYGHYCDMMAISEFAKINDVLLIEDACLAYGGSFDGNAIGSFGDVSVISFGYDKPINLGYGGAVLVNSEKMHQASRDFLGQNQIARFDNDDVLTLLDKSIAELPTYVAKRKENIAYLQENIRNPHFVKCEYNQELVYWRYPLFIKNRAAFLHYASQRDVLFTTHYKSLSDLQTNADCPNAERIAADMINLFVRYQTPKKQLEDMVNCINEYQPQ